MQAQYECQAVGIQYILEAVLIGMEIPDYLEPALILTGNESPLPRPPYVWWHSVGIILNDTTSNNIKYNRPRNIVTQLFEIYELLLSKSS